MYRISPGCTARRIPLRIALAPLLSAISPSVSAIAAPAVIIQRSAVVSCVWGGSSGNTIRTFVLMLYGASKSRELIVFFASLSFHRFWISSLDQKEVLFVGT